MRMSTKLTLPIIIFMCSYKFVITDVPGVSYDALFNYTLNNIDVDFQQHGWV